MTHASPTSIRGPLKYTIDTSSPQVEAGKRFSVSVRVTNPYDVPVVLYEVETKLPAKFVSFPETDGPRPSRGVRVMNWLQEVVDAGSVGGELVKATTPTKNREPVTLQPGNSTVHVFVLRTTNSTFFTPSAYNLNIEVLYSIDGSDNRDTVSYQMNVRAPLGAIIFGSVCGALIGFVVRDNLKEKLLFSLLSHPFNSQATLSFLLMIATNLLVGGIVVVAFARKKDAQPILSIEDFWGGLFVGFLSAYGRQGLLAQVT